MAQHHKNNIFYTLNHLHEKLARLESKIDTIEENFETALNITRCHVMRLKNQENLPDSYILTGRTYNDLSPEKSFEMYQNQNLNFILLDVSAKGYTPVKELPEAIKLPLEELAVRHTELANKVACYMVISEDGTRSILACELLNRFGYFNLNNISGGYKYWPPIRAKWASSEEPIKVA